MTQPKDVSAAPVQQPVIRRPVTVFFVMVKKPTGEAVRVGKAYRTRKDAQDWASFVRAAWRHRCRVSVRQMTVRFGPDGQIDEKTKRRLDREFNMDPPYAG